MQRHGKILCEAGYHVCLVGRKKRKSLPLQHEVFEQKRLNCFFEKGKLFYIEYNLRLLFYLLFAGCDILLAVDYDTLLPNTVVAKLRGKKLVFDAHEYFTEVPELYHRKAVKYCWSLIGNTCIPKVDLAYTVGPALAKLFTQQHGIPFHSIMNVPPLQSLASFGSNQPIIPIILYQGALNVGRGIEELIFAMREIEAVLWIAGEGDLSESLRALVQAEKLHDKVVFLGFVLPNKLPELTLQAHICCNLLLPNGLSYYYSLANKFFDYIHAGKPQICANFPEYEAINKEHEVAVLCKAEPNEIAAALNKLLNDKELYEKLRNNCKKAAQVYNLREESQKLQKLFACI
jgi:glycosyltransferase involved in cell wall biosynthesis